MSESDLVRTQNAQAREIEQLLSIERAKKPNVIATPGLTIGAAYSPDATNGPLPRYDFDEDGDVVLHGYFGGASSTAVMTVGQFARPSETFTWPSIRDDATYEEFSLDPATGAVLPNLASGTKHIVACLKYRMASARAYTVLPLTNGWNGPASPGYTTPGYYVTSEGIVSLRGLMKNTTPANLNLGMATMPEEARPAKRQLYLAASASGKTRIDIDSGGVIAVIVGGSTTYTSIDGMEYLASWSALRQNDIEFVSGSGWDHFDGGSTYSRGIWVKDRHGWVRLFGMVKSGPAGSVIGYLPVGARPAGRRYLWTLCGGEQIAKLWVQADGAIYADILPANSYLSLNGFKFKAA